MSISLNFLLKKPKLLSLLNLFKRSGFLQLILTILLFSTSTTVSSQIIIRSQTSSNVLSGTSLIINKPLGTRLGDVMLVNISTNNTNAAPTSAGWTLYKNAGFTGSGSASFAVLYKIVKPSDTVAALTNYTFTVGTGANASVGAILTFSGVDTLNPFDATAVNIGTGTNTRVVTANTITTTTANAAVIMFGQVAQTTVATTWSNTAWKTTNVGALTEIYDLQGGVSTSIGAAWANKPTAGATGAGTDSLSQATNKWGGVLVALKSCLLKITTQPPTNTILCEGGTLSMSTVVAGTGVSYQWKKNGVIIPGATAATYTVPNVLPSDSGIYNVTVTNRCGVLTSTNDSVRVGAISVTLSADYCTIPGRILLKANALPAGGFFTYQWSNGGTTDTTTVTTAGTYTVSVTNASGCTVTLSIPVSGELNSNGNFNLGNVGFTSPLLGSQQYIYVPDSANYQGELIPTGRYGIGTQANNYNATYRGRDHTSGTGNFMIAHGFTRSQPIAWQNTIPVTPNTTYYFSAWGMGLDSIFFGAYASLKFTVNGTQVGTNLPLTYHGTSDTSRDNWKRFYATWNSGTATSATFSIANTQISLAGNSFGLDDISIGVMGPFINLVSDPSTDSQTVCINTSIVPVSLNIGSGGIPVVSGLPPGVSYTYNGYNLIISGNPSLAGIYNFTVSTAGCNIKTFYGQIICQGQNINLSSAPATANQSVCLGNAITNITYSTVGNVATATVVGLPLGLNAVFASGVLTISGTPSELGVFNYTISTTGGNCSATSSQQGTVTINEVPTLTISIDSCSVPGKLRLKVNPSPLPPVGTYTFLWSNGATTDTTSVGISGTYSITITNQNGCKAKDSVTVSTGVLLTSPSGSVNQNVCLGNAMTNVIFTLGGNVTSVAVTGLPAGVTYGLNGNILTLSGTPTATGNSTYTVTITSSNCATAPATLQTVTGTINVTIKPAVTISADYCVVAGKVKLKATATPLGIYSFLWSNGVTADSNIVDVAGPFSVTITNNLGCQATATYVVGNEISFNGNFNLGNTGFTTINQQYTYVPDSANFRAELYVPGLYGIGTNANNYHDQYYGHDHTSGTGNFLIAHGFPLIQPNIWEDTLTVVPNTTYYFSGWALGLDTSANVANLKFSVNGNQLGNTLTTTPHAFGANSPDVWKRFYATWNSGTATSAIFTINDAPVLTNFTGSSFGLDDISIGTILPFVTLTSNPVTDTQYVCVNTPITNVTFNIGTGGTPVVTGLPTGVTYTYNGYNLIISGTPTVSGIFNYTVATSGCSVKTFYGQIISQSQNIILTSAAATTNQTICLTSPIVNISYTTISSVNSAVVTGLPTGLTVTFVSGLLTISGIPTQSGTFNYTVTTTGGNCSALNTATGTIIINTKPVFSITSNYCILAGKVRLQAVPTPAGTYTFAWSNGINKDTTTVSASGTYTVTVTNSTGCTSSASITVAIGFALTSAASTRAQQVCLGNPLINITYAAAANITAAAVTGLPTGVTYNFTGGILTISGTPTQTGAFTYRITSNVTCFTAPKDSGTITITVKPTATIVADYCAVPGKVKLRVIPNPAGTYTYLWSNGSTVDTSLADVAGIYTVTVSNSVGCSATASLSVGFNQAINGDFSAGNTGFTCPFFLNQRYQYVADSPNVRNELINPGLYGIGPNANNYDSLYYGRDHTTRTGNFMIVHGFSVIQPIVWQETISVIPNTTYYFSAWAMGLDSLGLNPILKFTVNGTQVGVNLPLVNHGQSNSAPDPWVRFYGTWNSGTATTANFAITNTQTVSLGNGFGLDDISIGYMAPFINLVSSPATDTQIVCQNTAIIPVSLNIGTNATAPVVTGLPPGVTSTYNGYNLVISGSPTTLGTFNYTVSTAGCTIATFYGQIISQGQAVVLTSAPASNNQTVCTNNAIANITYTAGNAMTSSNVTVTGLPAGVTAAVNAAVLTISGVPTQTGVFNYTVSVTGGICSVTNTTVTATGTITINAAPLVTITADYCAVPGKVRLIAVPSPSGTYTYLWNTGVLIDTIVADLVGTYTVTVTNALGCTVSASIPISQEIAINGNFSQGNFGFVTPLLGTRRYSYVADSVNYQRELYPNGTYGVGPSANNYHDLYWGHDHTSRTGNFMIVHGFSGAQPIVWQETLPVNPNTNYYFSAWAMSLNNFGFNASLRFDINGVAVGSTPTLPNHGNSNTSTDNWTRFYGVWNSGTNTSAVFSITNQQTAPIGNSFGLDDISISSLDPYITLTSSGVTDTQTVCINNPITNVTLNVGGNGVPPTVTGLPAGVTSTFNGATLTISGAPTVLGTFNYTVSITGCAPRTFAGQIISVGSSLTLTSAAATTNQSICLGTAITNTTYASTGTYTSINTTGLPTGVTAVLNAGVLTISGTPTQTGTFIYTISVIGGSCSVNNIKDTIAINAIPVASISAPVTVVTCTNPSILLTASGGLTYSWNNGLGSSSTPTVTTAGIYTVTAIGAGGCSSTSSINITSNLTAPVAGIINNTGTNTITCISQSINVTATGGGTYSWSGGLGSAANATITAAGTYTVTVTAANGCTDTSSITTTINAILPIAGITNNTGTTILNCTTSSISVTATGDGTYSWSGGLGTTANATITAAGTYTVTVTATSGCTATSSITTTLNTTPPTPSITNNTGTTIISCTNPAISVTAAGGVSYSWSGGLGSAATASITTPGTYTVTVTAANGCTATSSITTTLNNTPPIAGITNNTGSTIITCSIASISVTATGGGTYLWSGGLGAAASAVITTGGTYTVTVTATNGCTATSSITTTLNNTPPTVGITNNSGTTIITCATPSISVTATGGTSYSWSGGLGTAASASIVAAGTYTVTVFAATGCSATSSITTTLNTTAPTAGITNNSGTTIVTCSAPTVNVTATGGVSYSWTGGLGTASTAAITAAGTYTVTVTAANGCTATKSITTTANITPPTAGITNNSATTIITCTRPTISVTATGGGTYLWSGGLGSVAAATINTAGTFTVTVTGTNGCTATSSITTTLDNTPPTVGITNNSGTTIITCTTPAISVTASGGGTYSWSGGLGTAASASITAAGTYTVTVTGTNGCTATSSIITTLNKTAPTAGITNNSGTTIITCTTPSISVTATGGVSYIWSGTLGTTANASITAAGTFSVTVTAANGCTAATSIITTTNTTPPTAAITNNSGTTVLTCSTPTINVTATGGGTYSWSGGLGSAAALAITTPGIYSVTVTGTNGCTATSSITTTQNITLPTAGITNNTGTTIITCTTPSISLTATGGGTYLWSGGLGTLATASITTAGTYTVTVTATNGCTATSSITTTANNTPPTVGITNNTGTNIITCSTPSISVTATGGGTYSWSGGLGTVATATIIAAGTYTVTVTIANGCTSTASIITTLNKTAPTAAITNNSGSTVITCTTPTINVTATGGGTYLWSGTLGTAATATIISAGTYTVTVTAANGCTATSSIITTLNTTAPTAAITNNTGTTVISCTTPSINVTATGGTTYLWSGGLGSTAAASITAAGTYTVTVTAANGCTATASIITTLNNPPPIAGITNNTGTTIITCTTPSISVTATGGGTYLWSGGLGTAATVSITAAGTYTVTVTATNGCTATASIITTLNKTAPTPGITNNSGTTVVTCATPTINVTATGGTTYSWSGGLGTAATAAITAAGTYTVTVTAANGCTAATSITTTLNKTAPIAGITNNSGTTIITCTTPAINVTATGGTSYLWSGTLGSTAAASITTAGTFTVTVTAANGCTATSSITTTTNNPPPTAGITNNTGTTVITCSTPSISLTATGGGTYSWSGGLGTAANVNITAAGTYTVTVTNSNGCAATSSVVITLNKTAPTAAITNNSGTTIITCTTPTINLTATGGTSYSWSGGLGTAATAAIAAAGTYTVTVTAANGCTAVSTITTTSNTTPPTAGITNNSATTIITCTRPSISVTATGGGTYLWSGGLGSLAAASITTAGTYSVTVTAANGCTAISSITTTLNNTPPTAGITNNSGTTLITCTTPTLSVTATGGGTYSWSGGLGSLAAASITTAGTYTVTVTGTNGCTATSSIITTLDKTAPTAGITNNSGTTIVTCTTPTINVTATGGVSYSWSGGLGTAATALISAAGTYTVTVTGTNGCTATSNIITTLNKTAPIAGITNNTGTTITTCTTPTINVTATGGVTYSWSGGLGTTAAAAITAAGIYTVTATGSNGCTATSSITITANNTPPTAGITNNSGTTIITCTTPSINVTATGGGTYSWSGGLGSAAAISITAAGTYTVTVTSTNGCTATSSITTTLNKTAPVAGVTNNTGSTIITCLTPSISVTATGGGTYSWSGGLGTAANATIATAGTYTVTVTATNGCTATSSITTSANNTPPTAAITNNTGTTILTCAIPSINVTATGGGNYLWSGGLGTLAAASITAAGTYTVTVTAANGCTANSSITITANNTPPIAGITNNSGTTIITCTTPFINVTATGGGTYSWSGGLGSLAAASITAAGTYTVTVTATNGCTATSSINTTINNTPPTSGITNNTGSTIITCLTPSISVTATGGGTYSWSGGLGTAANATIANAGTYTVTVTATNGCTATSNITTTINNSPPTAAITNNTGTTILTCAIPSINVTATGGGNYLWSGGLGTLAAASITAAGTYTVTVTAANGCTANSSITITANNTPPIAGITNNSGTTIITCTTPFINVTATGGGTYSWSGGLGSLAAASITAAGTYTVTVTATNGCTATSSINTTINNTPPTSGITNNTGSTIITCLTPSISVTATGGGTYSWSGGLGTAANATIATAGTYTVTVTATNGCTATSSITTTLNNTPPTAGITNNSGTTNISCASPAINVTATGGGNYLWSGGLGTAANAIISTAGIFTVTVTSTNGCTSTSSITTTNNIPANISRWLGINNDWNNAANWCGGNPTATRDVIIPTGLSIYPVLTTITPTALSITIESGASLTINNSGALLLKGNLINNGTLINNGRIELCGTTAQSFPGPGIISAMDTLQINNLAGVTINKSFDVYKELRPTKGILSLGNFDITLKSNSVATAQVSAISSTAGFNYGTGRFIVERYIPTGTAAGQHGKSWQLVCAPVKGNQTIKEAWQESALYPNHNPNPGFGTQITSNIANALSLGFDLQSFTPSMKTYNAATNTFVGVPNTNATPVQNNLGYMLFVRGNRNDTSFAQAAEPATLRSKGMLFNIGVDAPPVSTIAPGQFQSVANPYASAIDFANTSGVVFNRGAAIDNTYYALDPSLYNLGGYQTVSSINNWKPIPGGTTNYPTELSHSQIQSGQAFFMHASGAGGTVTFNENAKTAGSLMVNRGATISNNVADQQMLETKLYAFVGGIPRLTDGNLLVMSTDYSNENTNDDAKKVSNGSENFSLTSGGNYYAIEARNIPGINDTIYYSTANLKTASYQLEFIPEQLSLNNLTPYLIDKYLQNSTQLSTTDTTRIAFSSIANSPSAAADRFKIVFQQNVVLPVTITKLKAQRKNKNQVLVEWAVDNEINISSYQVERSADGKRFSKINEIYAQLNNGNSSSYQFDDANAPNSNLYYRIRVIENNVTPVLSNVVKVNGVSSNHEFVITPNPIKDNIVKAYFTSIPEGNYTVSIFNTDGQCILTQQSNISSTDLSIEIKIPQYVAKGMYTLKMNNGFNLTLKEKFIIP